MKPSSPTTLSLLLLFSFLTSLPLSASLAQQVRDSDGNPIFPGSHYQIVSNIPGQHSGLKLAKTGNSNCPTTLLQDPTQDFFGLLVNFTVPGISIGPGLIFNGTPLEINVIKRPACASSSTWLMFLDNELKQKFVGIGVPKDHPGQQTFNGTFNIQIYESRYVLEFCGHDLNTCYKIGRYTAKNGTEGGSRLYLTKNEPLKIAFIYNL